MCANDKESASLTRSECCADEKMLQISPEWELHDEEKQMKTEGD